ncbi:DUF2007 domain-containing protein [Myxococcaceae bacterium JPH2]|nr:DUF2007 domain-containing protein [Myxococcaceae bacterium JPH2]
MKRAQLAVYRTVGEARLIASALESAGVAVELRGEALAPLVGEIPSTEAWVELWVWPHEVDTARQVLEDLRENEAAAQRVVACPKCREENPGNFEVCWSCGLELPSGLRAQLRAV